jgi:chloramphenicol 3-O-phosphotransferase
VQLHCGAPIDLLVSRYENRTDRHPGHLDHVRATEMRQRFTSGVHAPLALDGQLIEVDTSAAVDVNELARDLRDRA